MAPLLTKHPQRTSIAVAIAHSDALSRDLLVELSRAAGHRVDVETSTAEHLVRSCAAAAPDVVLTASVLDDGPVVRRLAEILHHSPVLILAPMVTAEPLVSLLAEGASGFVLDDSSSQQIIDAIECVAAGEVALHPAAADTIVRQWRLLRSRPAFEVAGRTDLTARESQILAAMAEGLATKAIARELGVAPKTIENHKTRIFDKLGVQTNAQAVARAIGMGWSEANASQR